MSSEESSDNSVSTLSDEEVLLPELFEVSDCEELVCSSPEYLDQSLSAMPQQLRSSMELQNRSGEQLSGGTDMVRETGRGRRMFFFTWNNPLQKPDVFHVIMQCVPDIRYFIFQLEKGENGTPHYQGYMQFQKPKRTMTLQKWLQKKGIFMALKWCTDTNDSVERCIAYCSKEETRVSGPWVHGEPVMGPGERVSMKRVAQDLIEGKTTTKRICIEQPGMYVLYHRGFVALEKSIEISPWIRKVRNSLYIGPTNVGKTYKALSENQEAFKKPPNKWFDYYQGQETVVWDDFAGAMSKMELTNVLQCLDGYRHVIETKGGSQYYKATRNIVTTNIHPHNWYGWTGRQDQLPALARRFHEVLIWKETDVNHVPGVTLTESVQITKFFCEPESFGYESVELSYFKSLKFN